MGASKLLSSCFMLFYFCLFTNGGGWHWVWVCWVADIGKWLVVVRRGKTGGLGQVRVGQSGLRVTGQNMSFLNGSIGLRVGSSRVDPYFSNNFFFFFFNYKKTYIKLKR